MRTDAVPGCVLLAHPLQRAQIEQLAPRLRKCRPDLDVVYLPQGLGSAPGAMEALGRAEVLLCASLPTEALVRAPRLRWVAHLGSGIDHLPLSQLASAGVHLTTARGVSAPCIAEFVLSQLLMLARAWPSRLLHQAASEWSRLPQRTLRGMTLGICGFGAIGREVARLARPFGMRVLATCRALPAEHPDVDTFHAMTDWPGFLRDCDVLVLCVPLTKETAGLVDRAAIASMRRGSWLINVARGDVVDEDAVADALEVGYLGAACLDVFRTEPLVASSRLWTTRNLHVSAHDAVIASDHLDAILDLFAVQFECHAAGKPLPNLVDLEGLPADTGNALTAAALPT